MAWQVQGNAMAWRWQGKAVAWHALWLGEATAWAWQLPPYGLALARQRLGIPKGLPLDWHGQLHPYGLVRHELKFIGLVNCLVWHASV